jgi:monofunctional biosynthetic peptidoglycan transglycosylase
MPRKEPHIDVADAADLSAAPALRAEARAPVAAAARVRSARPRRLRWLLWLTLAVIAFVPLSVVALRWLPPPTTAYMLQSPTRPLQYRWVPAARTAEVARRAVVAAEDQKFWDHAGFDLEAIEKARAHNQRSKRRRGASTISQQTAKNLFLWPGGGYFRKGLEAGITLWIEALWSKQRILEMYLNIAEFGPGIYGVEAAAQAYFGKPAAKLTPVEAARLAAVLPSPRRWSAGAPGAYVQRRTRWILGQMGYAAPVVEPELPPATPEEDAAGTAALPEDAQPVYTDALADEAALPPVDEEAPPPIDAGEPPLPVEPASPPPSAEALPQPPEPQDQTAP